MNKKALNIITCLINRIFSSLIVNFDLMVLLLLPRVGGTRDENNGFEIGWLALMSLRLQSLLITINTALSLCYTIWSSPLHMHQDSQSSLVVS
jgi:hypothetical protein